MFIALDKSSESKYCSAFELNLTEMHSFWFQIFTCVSFTKSRFALASENVAKGISLLIGNGREFKLKLTY